MHGGMACPFSAAPKDGPFPSIKSLGGASIASLKDKPKQAATEPFFIFFLSISFP